MYAICDIAGNQESQRFSLPRSSTEHKGTIQAALPEIHSTITLVHHVALLSDALLRRLIWQEGNDRS